ncbi:ATP-binding protein [Streptomyces sp. NPDC005728]|uniref:ATP-binding protein n=1 Tax=Streptomyces sp. NPDC005728 TaxID=3157054 RepID=UPI0033DB4379
MNSGAVFSGPAAAFELPALPAAVGTARRVLRDLLAAWGVDEPARDDVVLVASELVTNALVHAAGEQIVCRVHSSTDRVRLEVEDQNRGPARPVPRQSGPDDQNGRGLFLVDALSIDWGVALAPGRPARVVWADLTTSPRTPDPAAPAPPAALPRTDPAPSAALPRTDPAPPPALPRTDPHSSEGTTHHVPADSCP